MKKILGICGDSFMASVSKNDDNLENGYGKHFTDILKEMLGCEIITYAKGGVSNQCIRLQIDEVIKHNPHHIIIGTTSPDRIEIPLNNLKVNDYFEKWKNHYFKPDNGLSNILYKNSLEESGKNKIFNDTNPIMFSNSINNILYGNIVNEEMKEVVNSYFQFLYDMEWKKQQDTWIISEGVYKLLLNNFNFHLITPILDDKYFSFCEDKVIKNLDELNPWTYYNDDKEIINPFHLSNEDSEILANKWFNLLKDKI
jgi:hypothetical protein